MKLVDLFCGCGGFSLGAHQSGLAVAAAYDIDPNLTSSYQRNFPKTKLVLEDVSKLDADRLFLDAGGQIDGIFGGPPCQGFSDIGRRAADDPRRKLLGHFYRLVGEVEPTFFIMENVRGLAYADARDVLSDALAIVKNRYHVLGPHIWEASQFGAATKRQRLFVIGIHKKRGAPLTLEDIAVRKRRPTSVKEAIADLADATCVGQEGGFDQWQISRPGRPSNYALSLRSPNKLFTGHSITVHRPEIAVRFAKIPPGKIDPIGRHAKLDWNGQCPSLRAGTGSDKGSFQSVRPIHPSAPRVITVREAARLQGFPDEHRFHPTIWHSFRMIGNSVSPIIAREIFLAIAEKLSFSPELSLAAE